MLDFLVSRLLTLVWLWVSTPNFSGTILFCIWVEAYWFSAVLISKWPSGGHIGFWVSGLCRRHGFRSVSQVCFGISISNFICMLLVGKGLLIFSDVTFKMAAWWSYGIFFGFQTLTLIWLWISTANFSGTILMYMGRSLLILSHVNFKMAAWQPC